MHIGPILPPTHTCLVTVRDSGPVTGVPRIAPGIAEKLGRLFPRSEYPEAVRKKLVWRAGFGRSRIRRMQTHMPCF